MGSLLKAMSVTAMGALFAIGFVATTTPKASAEDWCRFNEHNLASCGFRSYEQCSAFLSGRAGSCDRNPFPGKAAAVHPIVVYTEAEYAVCRSMKLDCVGGGSSAYAYAPKSSKHRVHRVH